MMRGQSKELAKPVQPNNWTQDPIYQLVSESLPRGELKAAQHKLLVLEVTKVLRRWPKIKQSLEPRGEQLKQLYRVCGALTRAAKKAEAALLKCGADKDMDKAIANERWLMNDQALGTDITKPLRFSKGYSARFDLYLIAQTAIKELSNWDLLWGHERNDPRTFASRLTGELHTLICRMTSYRKYQFEQFLARISKQHGLPTLTYETHKKRRQRSKTGTGTK